MERNSDIAFERLQSVEQEILDVFHEVCTAHGLRYSLMYGTLLGAVRHGTFIPWDDDIDVAMPREDYQKLLEIWDQSATDGYVLQNKSTDPDFTQSFTKIRKDHTTFLQDESEREKRYHKGIFIDVFPGDRVANGKIGRMLQYAVCAVAMLYSREHKSGTGGAIGVLETMLLRAPKNRFAKRRTAAEKWITHWNHNCDTPYMFASTLSDCRIYYPADLFENMRDIEFGGKRYRCAADVDTVLRIQYNDYTQLPPEEERVWKHHPIIIDFEHNYEELEL